MKKYYLVTIDSYNDYYHCSEVYKAESEKVLREYLKKHLASDQYVVSIKEVDFENNQETILKQVSPEKKIYSLFREI